MYTRYCRLATLHRRSSESEAATAVTVTAAATETEAAAMCEDDDWERRYRLLPGPAGLATSSGLDEEAHLTLSQSVLETQRAGAKGGRRSSGSCGPRLLLLAGPAGSGKSYLIGCLPAECPDSLVLSVPATSLLPRRRDDAGAGAAVRRLFEFALSRRQPCLLAIENLESLLDNEAAPEPCQTARKVAQAIASCLQACRADSRDTAAGRPPLAVIVTTRRPWLVKAALSGLFHHRLCLSRPDAQRRRLVLANVARRADAFAPFRESLNAGDFSDGGGDGGSQLLKAVLSGTEGMSPGDLISVLHQAANYPLKRMVYQQVRVPESGDQLRLDPEDIHQVLAECQARVSPQEWQEYADWAEAAS